MTRADVMGIVSKHLANALDGIDQGAIDGSKSMKDYGANSLDMVEVVSAAMREMKVKVPRAELNTLTNIDGLVDLLYRVKQESESVKV
jgi:acyl carrier protein